MQRKVNIVWSSKRYHMRIAVLRSIPLPRSAGLKKPYSIPSDRKEMMALRYFIPIIGFQQMILSFCIAISTEIGAHRRNDFTQAKSYVASILSPPIPSAALVECGSESMTSQGHRPIRSGYRNRNSFCGKRSVLRFDLSL